MNVTAYDIAERFVGIKEVPGPAANPLVLGMLKLDGDWPTDDAVPWCSAFVNYVCWLLRLPRSKSLAARSWLGVGHAVPLLLAEVGFDVIILKRGAGNQPGPDVVSAPGHVGFYAGAEPGRVLVLGGNQGDSVSVQGFPDSRVLGVRRLNRQLGPSATRFA